MASAQLITGIMSTLLGSVITIFKKFIANHIPLGYWNMPVKSKKSGKRTAGWNPLMIGSETPNEFFGRDKGKKIARTVGSISIIFALITLIVTYLGISLN